MGTEANPHGSDDHEKLPPMRSQTELNLPPVEPWPEPVNGKQLLDELMQWLARLVVLPNGRGKRWRCGSCILRHSEFWLHARNGLCLENDQRTGQGRRNQRAQR